jgi:hypothetical protein
MAAKEIENIWDFDLCVDHISNRLQYRNFIKTTKRFLKEVEFFKKEEFIHLIELPNEIK